MWEGRRGITIFALPLAALLLVWGVAVIVPADYFPAVINPLPAVRTGLDARLEKIFPAREKALLSGLLFGGANKFSSEWKKVFQLTGTSHLIAVSGMNVTFVAEAIGWCVTRLRLSPRRKFWLMTLTIGFYICMVGAPASAIRAGFMAVAGRAAPLFGRQNSVLHGLSLAVIIMVVLQPSMVFSLGFQLSVLATAGLLLGEQGGAWWQEALTTTFWATIFTLPLVSYKFGVISMVALPVNMLVVPLIAPLTLIGVFVLGLAFVAPPLASVVGGLLNFLLAAVLEFLRATAALPVAAGHWAFPWWLVALWYGALLAYFFRKFSRQIR